MQISEADQECLDLFDPNMYQEGEGPRLGNCYIPPTYDELMAASTENDLKLLPNSKDKFLEFILKEQQVRLNPKVQQLYKDMNHSSAVEHAIHSELFKSFGYDDCPLNHKLYFALTRKYSNDPELKSQVFFWRNNVMHGSRVKLSQIPPQIPLLTLDNKELLLEQLLISAHEEQKLCVIFAEILCQITLNLPYNIKILANANLFTQKKHIFLKEIKMANSLMDGLEDILVSNILNIKAKNKDSKWQKYQKVNMIFQMNFQFIKISILKIFLMNLLVYGQIIYVFLKIVNQFIEVQLILMEQETEATLKNWKDTQITSNIDILKEKENIFKNEFPYLKPNQTDKEMKLKLKIFSLHQLFNYKS